MSSTKATFRKSDMLEVEKWQISEITRKVGKKLLKLDPDYQRREVWKKKNKILLIDSLARSMPVGAITVFEHKHNDSYSVYDVIDGRQRLSALKEYIDGEFDVEGSVVESASTSADLPITESELADALISAGNYANLPQERMLQFDEYTFPVFVIKGSRMDAVNAFIRMNTNLYGLKPQEIRNAVFNGTSMLKSAQDLCDELTDSYVEDGQFFVNLGIVSTDGYTRMQDVQFVLECLLLVMDGPQHRRDDLDSYCNIYSAPKGSAEKKLTNAIADLKKLLVQLWQLTDGETLRTFHFPANCENDAYALLGAFKEVGKLTKPQLDNQRDDIISAISEFRRLVTIYTGFLGDESGREEDFPESVKDYAVSLLKGQVNSKSRRTKRVEILTSVIKDVVTTIDDKGFSQLQRDLIWAKSEDKKCGRCGEVVDYSEYHAGHITSRASGGRSLVQNGRVEHDKCNLKAGAD